MLERIKERLFTETNPDKGTETKDICLYGEWKLEFTETNPDKGTETSYY